VISEQYKTQSDEHQQRRTNPNQVTTFMFDSSQLTENDKEILGDFYSKRKRFDTYLKDNQIDLFTCPGCAYPTLSERGQFEICPVCNWEDDGSDDSQESVIGDFLKKHKINGPNGNLSLTENRLNIGRTLQHNADTLDGIINVDTARVLSIIVSFTQRREQLGNRMTGDEPITHPLWIEWKQIEKDLQVALVHTTKQK